MSEAIRTKVTTHNEPGWDYGYRKSAFFHLSLKNNASYTVYNNRLMPVNQGEDRIEGYWALRKGVAFFDTGERPLEIKGPDAEKFCNKLFTKDITKLKPGRATYGILCYYNGKLLCDGVLMRLANDRFWYVQADGEAYTWFMAHAPSMDVEIIDPNSTVVQIQGPDSMEFLEKASDSGMPDPFTYFGVAEIEMGNQRVIISRTGYTAELGFEIYTFDDELDAHKLWDHLSEVGKSFNMAVCGLDSMDARRIEAGILNYGSDMDHTMTPYQAGLGPFVDLKKADFIGKEALTNAFQKTLVYGITCMESELANESPVFHEGQEVGKITASSWSPYLNCGVAIVRLHQSEVPSNRLVMTRGIDGKEYEAQIVDLPFYDSDKKIPRGIETFAPNSKVVNG